MSARPTSFEAPDVGPGMVWAYEFDEHGRGRLLSNDSPIDLIHGRRFVWVHMMLANARTRDWIASQNAMLPEARDVLLSHDGHPRIEWPCGRLVGNALRHSGRLSGARRRFDRLALRPNPQFLLTARRHPVFSADAVRKQIEVGSEFESSASLFERMLVASADLVGEGAHRIAARLDSIEDRVLSETFSDESGTLLKLRREVSGRTRGLTPYSACWSNWSSAGAKRRQERTGTWPAACVSGRPRSMPIFTTRASAQDSSRRRRRPKSPRRRTATSSF